MARSLLSRDDWNRLVNEIIIPALGPQLDAEKLNPHAAWVGGQLIEDKWTVSRARWAMMQVAKHYRKLDNLMAMLCQISDGQKDRDGNVTGGWYQSAEYRVENRAEADATKRNDCYSRYTDDPDWEPRCARQHDYCGECPGVKSRYRGKGGELASVGAMAEKILKGGK